MTSIGYRADTNQYLEVAAEIAASLSRTALTYDGQSTWLGMEQHGDGSVDTDFSYSTIAGDIYGGASGVALFLAEMYARTGEAQFKATAESASAYTLATWSKLPHRFRFGFYTGALGAAYALTRIGHLTDREDFAQSARRALQTLSDELGGDVLLDVISGAAGAVTPLLALSNLLQADELRELAMRLGDRIIAAAARQDDGWSWNEVATGFYSPRNLTGFGHGAAGIGWALLELYAIGHDAHFLHGALEAFRYENSTFLSERDNWPDFRFSDGRAQSAPCGIAWCLGAPGIGLSRLRALEIHPDAQHRTDADAALRATRRALDAVPDVGGDDFSLCHGWTGVADFLLYAERSTSDARAGDLARRIGEDGLSRNRKTQQWHCGLVRGNSPSLMLGIAGIGYFYLRLADPTVPSVLLVPPSVSRQSSATVTTGGPAFG